MKNQLRVSSVWNFTLLFTCLLSFFNVRNLPAQTFVAPSSLTSVVDIYPSSPSNPQWMARSCYSFRNASINGNDYDLFISAWRDANGVAHIVWRAMDATIPSTITTTGADTVFTIDSTTNIQNISVGIIRTGTGYQALVAYNDVGATSTSGVVLKVFDVLTTGPQINPIPVSSTMLYAKHNYNTRVCMDSWDVMSAVVWDEIDPITSDKAIKCLPIKDGLFFSPVLLNGTDDNTNADVAILSNTTLGYENFHFVYYNPVTDEITESMIDFTSIFTSSISGFVITPTIEDVNSVSTTLAPRPVLDCPSTFDYENWAYGYVTDASNNDVFVRLVDNSGSGTPTTIDLTGGSLGNAALSGWDNTWLTLTYGQLNPGNQDFYVAWQTSNSGTYKSVCVEVSMDGSTLLSANDYLQIPFATTYSPNGLLMCKNNNASMLYVIHSYNNNLGANQISHQFHYGLTRQVPLKEILLIL